MNLDWHKILTDKDYSEKKAFELLTSLSYDKDNPPSVSFLASPSAVPSLYGKHMMKKYFDYGNSIERPDIQSRTLDLGIEVTRLIDEKQIISLKAIEEVDKTTQSVGDFRVGIKKLDKKGLFAGDIQDLGFGRLINFDTSNIYDNLEQKIKEKITLVSDYENFNEYWLFMFSLAHIDEERVPSILNNIPDVEKFSTYIIMSMANGGEIWFIHNPYKSVEKRIPLCIGGVRNE